MKRKIALLISLIMIIGTVLTACGSGNDSSSNTDGANGADKDKKEDVKVALVCDPAGTQVFINMMITALKDSADEYGYEPIVVECADSAAYEDNIRALVEEGTDFIIVGGWIGGEALGNIAKEFPDRADYALIDSTVDADNVKCISYREQEGAYLIGMIAASVVEEGENVFGAVHVNQGPGSWKWRYGYMEGVKSINPEATFVFNYTGSYNDPAQAKESASLQFEQGAGFVNAACAGGDIGVFEAAKDLGFYTSGQDIDLTDPENPYIVSSQIKDTGATMQNLIDNYFSGNWDTENEEWGIAEGTIGAVHITHESENPISGRLSEDELQAIKDKAEQMRTGGLDIKVIPTEEEYNK